MLQQLDTSNSPDPPDPKMLMRDPTGPARVWQAPHPKKRPLWNVEGAEEATKRQRQDEEMGIQDRKLIFERLMCLKD